MFMCVSIYIFIYFLWSVLVAIELSNRLEFQKIANELYTVFVNVHDLPTLSYTSGTVVSRV